MVKMSLGDIKSHVFDKILYLPASKESEVKRKNE